MRITWSKLYSQKRLLSLDFVKFRRCCTLVATPSPGFIATMSAKTAPCRKNAATSAEKHFDFLQPNYFNWKQREQLLKTTFLNRRTARRLYGRARLCAEEADNNANRLFTTVPWGLSPAVPAHFPQNRAATHKTGDFCTLAALYLPRHRCRNAFQNSPRNSK